MLRKLKEKTKFFVNLFTFLLPFYFVSNTKAFQRKTYSLTYRDATIPVEISVFDEFNPLEIYIGFDDSVRIKREIEKNPLGLAKAQEFHSNWSYAYLLLPEFVKVDEIKQKAAIFDPHKMKVEGRIADPPSYIERLLENIAIGLILSTIPITSVATQFAQLVANALKQKEIYRIENLIKKIEEEKELRAVKIEFGRTYTRLNEYLIGLIIKPRLSQSPTLKEAIERTGIYPNLKGGFLYKLVFGKGPTNKTIEDLIYFNIKF